MATNTPSATAFSNTPQAANDLFLLNEDTVSLAGGNILTLDVMANDAGGNAKQLWSLDDTALFANLKLADTGGAWEATAGGNQMRIVNGKVELNLSNALSNYGGSVQGLGAGEKITDSFYYTIRLANGTISLAKADFTITGQNDAPTITSTARSVAFTEDAPAFCVVGKITATDADAHDTLTYSGNKSDGFGTFVINSGGVWSFQLNNSGAAVQSLAAGTTKTLTFPVTVSDGKGGTATQDVTVTITGTNDAPTISAASTTTGSTAEDGTATASGQIIASDIDSGATLTYSAAAKSSGAANFGTFSVDTTGKWSFDLGNDNAAVQSLAQGEVKTLVYAVTATDEFGATATRSVTIRITGTNDAPVITAADTTGDVAEDGTATATGQITASDVDNGATLTYSAEAQTAGSADYGSFSVDADGAWTFTLSNDSETVQSLAQGETVDLTYTVTVTDENGATATQDVTVTVTGTNDAPVITAADTTGDVAEDGTLTATGTVTASDIDNAAELGFSGDATGSYGSFVVDPATGDWTYTLDNTAHQSLAEGETQTETFTVTVTDEHGATATQDVTVTITGTNDAPVITAADTTGAVAEDGTATATGQITASDVDNGATLTYSAEAQTEGSADYGSFSVDADGAWTFTLSNDAVAVQSLAQGETAKLTYTVTVADEHGATDTQDVTVTITGTNDAPTITSAAQSGNVAEDGTATASGQIIAADVDTGATLTYSAEALDEANAAYGSFSVDADGKWSFALSNDSTAVQSLYQGATATLTYAVTVTDDHGATATQNVTVKIAGTNDAPVITSASTASVTEDSSISGQITATDVDRDNASLTFATQGAVPAGFTLAANGTYSFDAGSYDHLGAGQTETVHVSVVANDTLANSAPQDLAITITGVNDAATITNSNTTAALVEDSTTTTSGRLTVTDADTGEAGFRTPASLAGTYGSFTFDTATGQWGYTMNNASAAVQGLNAGASVTDSLTVQSTDGTSHVISVGITGSNDLPTFANSNTTAEVTEDSATQTASGTLSVTDKDTGQSGFQTPASLAGSYGTFTFNASTGAWGYTLNNAAASVQALNTGSSLVDTLTVKSLDNSTYTVGVKINGVNEPSAIPTTIGTVVTTSGADPNDTNGTGPYGSASNGSDNLAGTNGNDIIVGGSGDDTIYARNGNDVLGGDSGNDVIYASSGNDTLSGSDNNDLLYGGSGNDSLNGGNGSDTLTGGFGADIATGGANDDRFVFLWENDRGDAITDFNLSGTDKIDVSAIDANSASSGNQTFAWGGTGMTANGIWYVVNGGGTGATFYADTDGNTDTAEFWFTVNGTTFAATDFIL